MFKKDGTRKNVPMSLDEQLAQVKAHVGKKFSDRDLSLTLCAPVSGRRSSSRFEFMVA